MSNQYFHIAMIVFAAVFWVSPVSGQVLSTSTSCVYTETDWVFSCEVDLSQEGSPVSGAQIMVGADMPTMPLAHNIRPVEASENEQMQGNYRFEIELEMFGEWKLIYDIHFPFRDRLQENLLFKPQE